MSRTFTLTLLALAACKTTPSTTKDAGTRPDVVEGACVSAPDAGTVDFLLNLGCTADFQALASAPLDTTLPGARSVKVVLDQAQDNTLFFQNSVRYQIHYQFASTHLSGNGLPIVPQLAEFNTTEYFRPDRRFILGAVTYYDGPKLWVLELSPYDTASAELITILFRAVQAKTFFGNALGFHPTSDAVAAVAATLPADIPIVTTDEIYAGTDFQPLSLGSAIGRLRFVPAAEFDSTYLSYQDLVVLEQAPNDISVVQGMITQTFQTPLSHLNVLARNRKTPNMGLSGAMTNPELRAWEGQLVELTVGASSWSVRAASQEEAERFWAAHRPAPVTLPAIDTSVTELLDIQDVAPDPVDGGSLRDAIKDSVLAFGGKAAQYSVLARTPNVPIKKAFAIPVFYYDQFMRSNGFYARVEALLADPTFATDATTRDAALYSLRLDMLRAPVDADFQAKLAAKIAAMFPEAPKLRFRTSTNSEDLDGFPCAGCYESHSGYLADWNDTLGAIRQTYASTWLFRTFEERSYYGVAHDSVGMALLVHPNFPDEEANGVAVTANPFDSSGLDPAFYVNVQYGGDNEVVHPPPGVTSDQLLYYFSQPNQPVTYLAHSNLIPARASVLTGDQLHQLGVALDAIHARFSAAYGPVSGNPGWYAMDVEFKFDNDADRTKPATLYVKQARPYPRVTP